MAHSEDTGISRLRRTFLAGYPIVYVVSSEEDRVEHILAGLAKSLSRTPLSLFTWSQTAGLASKDVGVQRDETLKDPVRLLDEVLLGSGPAIYLLKDLPELFESDRTLGRKLRDCYYTLRHRSRFLCLLHPSVRLPDTLAREIPIVDLPLPETAELGDVVDAIAPKAFGTEPIPKAERTLLVQALKGLTLGQARHALVRVMTGAKRFDSSMVESAAAEKVALVRREGVLEAIPAAASLDAVGGLDVLKEWLERRAKLLTKEAARLGAATPRGVLLMGVPGCGKSLAVKAIAKQWRLPLFRLDMNLVFSGAFGPPESTFNRALKIMEAIAPGILWIDEIEMGMSGRDESGAGARIFGRFLTWMQERQAFVFVAATSNRIELIPAELLRRGRFDQIFYIDLPSEEERKQIFAIHLAERRQDLAKFDLLALCKATKGWNGAEIEQAVIAAIVDAASEGRVMKTDDLFRQVNVTIPLSTTMQEQIKSLRSWARNRAVNASKLGPPGSV